MTDSWKGILHMSSKRHRSCFYIDSTTSHGYIMQLINWMDISNRLILISELIIAAARMQQNFFSENATCTILSSFQRRVAGNIQTCREDGARFQRENKNSTDEFETLPVDADRNIMRSRTKKNWVAKGSQRIIPSVSFIDCIQTFWMGHLYVKMFLEFYETVEKEKI